MAMVYKNRKSKEKAEREKKEENDDSNVGKDMPIIDCDKNFTISDNEV